MITLPALLKEPRDGREKAQPERLGQNPQREDGRYELKVFVDTPDGRRKRVSVYASTWEDADAERTRLKDLQRKGIPVDGTTSTVEQYMQYWLTEIGQPSGYRYFALSAPTCACGTARCRRGETAGLKCCPTGFGSAVS